MKFFILFAAVSGTVLCQYFPGVTPNGGDCRQNSNCKSDKCCPDLQDKCCGSTKGKCCIDKPEECCPDVLDKCCGDVPGTCCKDHTDQCCPDERIINPEQCFRYGPSCVCRQPLFKKINGNEYKLCPPVGITATVNSQNCRSDPCNDQCAQINANILLAQLDSLSPADIQGIFKRDGQVSFYLGCVLGTGSCDGVGGAFKEALGDWAVSKQVCGRCNACQKRKVSFIISQLRNNPQYKTRYDQILAKFGGSGK